MATFLSDTEFTQLASEELIAKTMQALSAHGMRVDCAANAEEALRLIGQCSYDALLCDLNLTSGGGATSGSSAAQRILAASGDPKPAVIFMTGDFLENGDGEPKLGEPRRLQKPFRVSDVLTVLRDVFTVSPAEKIQD